MTGTATHAMAARRGVAGRARQAAGIAVAVVLAAGLAGCGDTAETGLAPDVFGCPALAGTYALPPEGAVAPSLDGTPWVGLAPKPGLQLPLGWYDTVTLATPAPGMLEATFFVTRAKIREQVDTMYQLGGPRYARWHALVQPAARASYEQNYGAGAYAEQMREFGPVVEARWSGTHGRDFTCKDGELQFARPHSGPLRITRVPDGGIRLTGRELKTIDIPVWCGDGCKDLPIPTGSRELAIEWIRTPVPPAWTPDLASLRAPREVVAEAERVRQERQAAVDRRVFASVPEIRDRLTPLMPPGGTLESVEIRDGAVHIVHRVPAGQEQVLTRAVRDFGEAPRQLQVVYATSRPTQRDVEFSLVDSALVRREPLPAWPDKAGTTVASGAAPLPTLIPVAPEPGAAALKARAQALVPAGMRVEAVRASGDAVFLTGTAPRNAVVSDGLRALDQAAQSRAPGGPRVELVSVSMGEGGVRYEIRVPRAILAAP